MSSFINNVICYKTVFTDIPIAGFIAELKERSDLDVGDLNYNKAYMRQFDTLMVDLILEDLFIKRLKSVLKDCLYKESPQSFEYSTKNNDDEIYLKIVIDVICIDEIELITGIVEDVSEQIKTQIKMQQQKKALESLNYELSSSKNLIDHYIPVSTTDLNGIITDCNEAFCNLTGYKKEELIGKKHSILKDYETPNIVYKNFWHVIGNNETYVGELKNRKKDGTPFWIRTRVHPRYEKDGTKIGYIAVREDITNAKYLEEKASMDALTKVFNRNKFNDFLTKELAEFHRYAKVSSLIICDIDHFKRINDRYGHLVGDEVLKEVALVLQSVIRDSDVLARWGGEEFIILLSNTSEKNAIHVANKIVEAVETKRFNVIENVTISCGVSEVYAKDTLNTWFKRADDALYQAKENGRNSVVCM